jgi:hypothetical protein
MGHAAATARRTRATVIHYQASDGVTGYRVGDILIEVETGATARVVSDGHGLTLVPTVADIPFAESQDGTRIGYRIAPLDIGFDLLEIEMRIAIAPDHETLRVSYATRDGERRVVSGHRRDVLRILRARGYQLFRAPEGWGPTP